MTSVLFRDHLSFPAFFPKNIRDASEEEEKNSKIPIFNSDKTYCLPDGVTQCLRMKRFLENDSKNKTVTQNDPSKPVPPTRYGINKYLFPG